VKKKDVGIVGLGVMGRNLALNLSDHGFSVAGYDLDPAKLKALQESATGKEISAHSSASEFVEALSKPRTVLIMVPAGKAVDAVINSLKPFLAPGDILIDGGNSFFRDTEQRLHSLEEAGILYVGAGISGGEEGARYGPAIMPGGNEAAWPTIRPILHAIAAKADDGTPCCDWIGPGGSGHFVKMVHNGIEYSDMQLICEAYFLMHRLLKLSPDEMSNIFQEWNQGELNSYLIEITARILRKKDPETGKPVVDVILDTAGQKGTGKWTSQVALDLGTPAATIAEAVFARFLSALKDERLFAARILQGPGSTRASDPQEFAKKIRNALYASKICCYAQGFQILRDAARQYGWPLQLGKIASIWRAGCIIRARFLNRIMEAYDQETELPNLLLSRFFREAIAQNQADWRDVVATAVKAGVPVPAFSSALAYYDSYRTERLPANLLQAQRDFFGAHRYERTDRPRGQFFHTDWTD
jgi:6-phosphogluconate dehydrogenase